MDFSDLSCLNCSAEDNKSAKPSDRGRRYGAGEGKLEETSSYLNKDEPPEAPKVIKIPRQDKPRAVIGRRSSLGSGENSTYRKETKGIDESVVSSSARFRSFSVQVYSSDSHGQDAGTDHSFSGKSHAKRINSSPVEVVSRASMISPTPYKISGKEQSLKHGDLDPNQEKIKTKAVARRRNSPISSTRNALKKDKTALAKFDPPSEKRTTLPGDRGTRIKSSQPDIPFASLSLPRNVRISQTDETLQTSLPQMPPKLSRLHSLNVPLEDTSIDCPLQLSSTNISPPLSPSRKRMVKNLTQKTKHSRTRKEFAQLYIASVQRRRTRIKTKISDQFSSHSSSSSEISSKSKASEIFSSKEWLEETEELISASNEALSRKDYFKIVFFEESLRRKLQCLQSLSLGKKVHTVKPVTDRHVPYMLKACLKGKVAL